ncbi:hypothetical protein JCM10213_005287 [Rhodosporidiobolus nylandii]
MHHRSEATFSLPEAHPSHLPPPPSSPLSVRPPRALLAAYALDADVRRAALDTLQRVMVKERAGRRRSGLSRSPPRDEGAGGKRKVELHVLLLPSTSVDNTEAQDTVLEKLEFAGIRMHVHPLVLPTPPRLAFSANPLCAALQQAFSPDGPYQILLLDELAAAGFVCGSQPSERNADCKAFLEILAKHTATAFPVAMGQPTVTLYIPPRPGTSDFDLDEVPECVLSLRLINSAAATFEAACPPPPSSEPKRSRLSWHPPSTREPPTNPRRTSYHTPLPSFLSRTRSNASPTLKPLVLRPAPGPIQSVSLRLPLDSSDVLFRVVEALTPVDASGSKSFDSSLPPELPSDAPMPQPEKAPLSPPTSPPSPPHRAKPRTLVAPAPPRPPPKDPRRQISGSSRSG